MTLSAVAQFSANSGAALARELPDAPVTGLGALSAASSTRPESAALSASRADRPASPVARGRQTPLGRAFTETIGLDAIEKLMTRASSRPIILVGGMSGAGKGTLAGRYVTQYLGRPADEAVSVGGLLRAQAAQLGIDLKTMLARQAQDPKLDVQADYNAVTSAATGQRLVTELVGGEKRARAVPITVLDGRTAGQMAALLRAIGRKNVVSVYLACEPVEALVRKLARDFAGKLAPEQLAATVSQVKQAVPSGATMEEAIALVEALKSPVIDAILPEMRTEASRDASDAARLKALYGFDFRDPSIYDVRIDTTHIDANGVLDALVAKLPSAFLRQAA